jgi:aldehyde:ferredoxin oxidoreductase
MGFTVKDDKLPRQIVTPFTGGPAAGSEPKIDMMLKEYYPLRNLDEEGKPQKDRLEGLGLSDLAGKL